VAILLENLDQLSLIKKAAGFDMMTLLAKSGAEMV